MGLHHPVAYVIRFLGNTSLYEQLLPYLCSQQVPG